MDEDVSVEMDVGATEDDDLGKENLLSVEPSSR